MATRLRLCVGLWLLLTIAPASAHEGPPFPILIDAPAGPYLVSIWTDPDVGTGTVFVVLDAPEGRPYRPPAKVRVGIAPVSGRLPETLYDARGEPVRRGGRFVALVPFDRQEVWRVRGLLDGPTGTIAVSAEVEATPVGSIGPIGLAVYALPFLVLVGLWIRLAVVRRRMTDSGFPSLHKNREER
jgi:hypothetical protein